MNKNIIVLLGVLILAGIAFASWKFILTATSSPQVITEDVPIKEIAPSAPDITEQP